MRDSVPSRDPADYLGVWDVDELPHGQATICRVLVDDETRETRLATVGDDGLLWSMQVNSSPFERSCEVLGVYGEGGGQTAQERHVYVYSHSSRDYSKAFLVRAANEVEAMGKIGQELPTKPMGDVDRLDQLMDGVEVLDLL